MRVENPLHFAIYPFQNKYVFASLDYALGEGFSVGFMGGTGRSSEAEIVQAGDLECFVPGIYASYCQKTSKVNGAAFAFLHYYPFASSLYFGVWGGGYGGEASRYSELSSFAPDTLAYSTQTPVEYTIAVLVHAGFSF